MTHRLLYVFLLSITLTLLIASQQAFAQAKDSLKTEPAPIDTNAFKLPPALSIGVDISYPIRYALDKDVFVFEAVADFRLNNTWYLAAELGYADAKKSNEFLTYTANGPYLKAGFNYNLLKSKKETNNVLYAGSRLVFSQYRTVADFYKIIQQYWPGEENGSIPAVNSSAMSLELLFGLKVEIIKSIMMGWSVRGAFPFKKEKPGTFNNLYLPGIGVSKGFAFNFNYTINYFLPFGKTTKPTLAPAPAVVSKPTSN